MSLYPGALDALANPAGTDGQNAPGHAAQHANANDALEAIQAALGIDPQGSDADVAERITTLEALIVANFGLGLVATHVGSTTANGGDPIILPKPAGTADGDLVIIAAAGHNATVVMPAGFDSRMSYDTDGQEPIYCWTKIASGEPANYNLDTNSTSTTITGAVCTVLRGPTAIQAAQVTDAGLTLANVNGHPFGVQIGVWVSALAAGVYTAPVGMTQHVVHRVAASQPAFCIASKPTINAFPIGGAWTAGAAGMSSQWFGNLVMVWA